jgi:T-complex protein 1 subunit gamma
MTELRSKHAAKDGSGLNFGIDGNIGKIADMRDEDIWDPIAVKL